MIGRGLRDRLALLERQRPPVPPLAIQVGREVRAALSAAAAAGQGAEALARGVLARQARGDLTGADCALLLQCSAETLASIAGLHAAV